MSLGPVGSLTETRRRMNGRRGLSPRRMHAEQHRRERVSQLTFVSEMRACRNSQRETHADDERGRQRFPQRVPGSNVAWRAASSAASSRPYPSPCKSRTFVT